MLKELTLTNFKSFAAEPQTIPFAPVTVFVGANGSGKSNAFDALRFLRNLASDLNATDALNGHWEEGHQVSAGIRGGLNAVAWSGSESFSIKSQFEFAIARGTRSVLHFVEYLIKDATAVVGHEQLFSGPTAEEAELIAEATAYVEGQETPAQEIRIAGEDAATFQMADVHFLSTTLHFLKSILVDGFAPAEAVLDDYEYTRFVNLRPGMMRDYVPAGSVNLDESGHNLSAAIQRIIANQKTKLEFLDWLSEIVAPPIVDIGVDETPLGDVVLALYEGKFGERRISARSLSDGTLRFMAFLTVLYSTPVGGTVLIEELENGLHPSQIHRLIELIEQFAESRDIQIVATTHSPQVLLGLSDNALRDVVLFARDEEHPGTIVRRLGDLEHFEEVTKKTSIDDLFSTGWLEFAV